TTTYFQWGLSASYGNSTSFQSSGSGTSAVAVSENINGLSANNVYYFRISATNSVGTTYGANRMFGTWLQTTFTTGTFSSTVTTTGAADVQLPLQFRSVAAGASHSLGVRSNGTLWAWGLNTNGQLGDGTTGTDRTSPVAISPTVTTWVGVAGGTSHSLGVRSDGTLWAWGLNTNGQLGDGSTTQRTSPVAISPTVTTWVGVAAGASHSLGIRSDGTLWAWGLNTNGQLGDGSTTQRTSPVQSSVPLLSISGTYTSAAITPTNASYWGVLTYTYTAPANTIFTVDVLSSSNNSILATNVSSGINLSQTYAIFSGITGIRLRGNFSSSVNTATPTLSDWGVTWTDDNPTYPLSPVVVATPATVSATSAVLNAIVNPNGDITTAWFEYGISATPITYPLSITAVTAIGSGTGSVAISATVGSLTSGTSYNFRCVATNSIGTTNGSNLTFITIPPPTCTTNAATNIANTTATLNGTVNPNGYNVTSCYFDYGTSESYGSQQSVATLPGSGSSPISVTANVSSLAISTTYNFRVVAINAGGTTNGNNLTFSTLSPYGTGADGALTVTTANTIISAANTYSTANTAAGATSIVVNATTGLAANNEIMIIRMKGATGEAPTTIGQYEFAIINSIVSTTLNLDRALTYAYNGTGNSRVQVVRVPNYTNVTITSPGTLICNAWNGTTGGVLAFRANGTLQVNVANGINATGRGFLAGAGTAYTAAATGGESYNGRGGSGGAYTTAGSTLQGGGGGGGENAGTNSAGAAGAAGSGGGGGGAWYYSAAYTYMCAGTGGGGGHATTGANGLGDTTGTAPSGTTGGGGSTPVWGGNRCGGIGGGGGQDGRTANGTGSATLNTIAYMGGGGGAGGGIYTAGTANGGNGGAGGGIIFIAANIINVASGASILSNGATGGNYSVSPTNSASGPGGGGAGGSVILIAGTLSNSGSITANAGSGGSGIATPGYNGGAGGGGRTYARFNTGPGTNAPTPNYYAGGAP
ncbi:MAG: hypothetical protein V1871_00985, partial [Planctomycetota bacterium]